jgi:uncharacterized cupredoxin-like copper-binding protein
MPAAGSSLIPDLAGRSPTPGRRSPTAARLACTLALIAGLTAGCGGSPPSPSTAARAGTATAPRDINVIMRDYLFEPNPIVLHPGETVRFNIINAGLLAHEFVLGDATVQAAWASAEALSSSAMSRQPSAADRDTDPGPAWASTAASEGPGSTPVSTADGGGGASTGTGGSTLACCIGTPGISARSMPDIVPHPLKDSVMTAQPRIAGIA